jgi:hypothetical protein
MTERLDTMRKQIRFLTAYAAVSFLLLAVAFVLIFTRERKTDILAVDELRAERITIIEPTGLPRLVLSNALKSPPGLAYGKSFGIPGGNRPGIIFYNDEATECGGLVFSGRRDSGGRYFATGHFSFDQYNQNQTLYFQYLDDNGERRAGLYVDDWHDSPPFPEWRSKYKHAETLPAGPEREIALKQLMEPAKGDPAFAHRVFVGKGANRSALIALADQKGRTRIQLMVDSLGEASIDFLNEKGKVVHRLPENSNH